MRLNQYELFGVLFDNGAFLDAAAFTKIRRAGYVLIAGPGAARAEAAMERSAKTVVVETVSALDKALKSEESKAFDAVLLIGVLAALDSRTQRKLLDNIHRCLAPDGRLHVLEPNAYASPARVWKVPEKARTLTHCELAELLADTGFAVEDLHARYGAAAPGAIAGRAFARFPWINCVTGAWMAVHAQATEDDPSERNAVLAARATATLRHLRILLCILLFALLCRLPGLNEPPLGTLFWRQTQTLMVARNFARNEMNILRPEVSFRRIDEPTERGYVGGTELQVIPWLSALLYRIFGEDYWAGRMPSILFSVLGIAFVHRLAARWRDETCASVAALFLAVSPQYWMLGRAHMPEAFVFCVSFAALYYYDRWLRTATHGDFVSGVAASTLTLLGKPQFGVIALPLAAATFLRRGWRCVLDSRLYLFAALPAVPTAAYLWYSYHVITGETGLSFAQPDLLRIDWIFDPEYHKLIWERVFHDAAGPLVSLTALGGLLVLPRRRNAIEWTAYAWALSAVAFFLIMPGGNRVNFYYQSMIAPPACYFAARAVCLLAAKPRGRLPAVALAAAIIIQSVAFALPQLNAPNGDQALACGRWIDENLPKNAKVLTLTADPGALYFADRIGWICWRQNRGESIKRSIETVEKARAHGAIAAAGVGANPFDNAQDRDKKSLLPLSDHLNERYYCVRTPDFVVYHLLRPADLAVAVGKTQLGMPEARKYLRGAWGPDQRTHLLEPFVALGPEPRAQLRFDTPPGAPRRLLLDVAPAQAGQEIVARLDGKEIFRRTFANPWIRQKLDLGEIAGGDTPTRRTIELEVAFVKGKIGLLLYGLELK